MDALRKAEQQKQLLAARKPPALQDAQPAGPELELVPHPREAPPAPENSTPAPTHTASPGTFADDRLPELPLRLEELDEQFLVHAAPRSAHRPAPPPPTAGSARAPATDTARANARLLFEAKRPATENRPNFFIVIGVLTLLVAGGIGGYVWWGLQPQGGRVVRGSTPAPRVPEQPSAPPIAAAPAPAAVPPAPTFVAAAAGPAAVAAENPRPPVATIKPAVPLMQAATTTGPEPPIRLTRQPQTVDPMLEQAWQAFNRKEFALAQAAWQRALATDPRNADALHGLAVLALRGGKPEEAADHYLRALESNPKDAVAFAGLVPLQAPGNGTQTESRLKNLLAEQPDSPHLNFALGNLYAGNQRWAEAQQAFFKAHTVDSGNPDYLFNLAVSLDHLHQTVLAARYYDQALIASERHVAGFDTVRAAERLKLLQPERQN